MMENNLILWITLGIILLLFIGLVSCCIILYTFQREGLKNHKRNSLSAMTLPIRVNGVNSSTTLSDCVITQESPRTSEWSNLTLMMEALAEDPVIACGVQKFSYKYLKKATNGFTTILGQGAFGTVYKAQRGTSEVLAVKVLDTDSRQGETEFLTEVLLLGRLHHRNLVNLVGYSAEKEHHMLVYDYMRNGSLEAHLYSEELEPLSWDQRIHIALDIARGLEYLHDGAIPPVVHRDIKSSNILLDESFKARVADFGLSRLEMMKRSSIVKGTYGYLDPEYIKTKVYSKKSDIYSFGVLLFELITGRKPQQDLMGYVHLGAMDTEGQTGWEVIVDSRLDGKFDAQQLAELAALAHKCIDSSPKERPSMRDTVQILRAIFKLRHKDKHQELKVPSKVEESSSGLNLDNTHPFESSY